MKAYPVYFLVALFCCLLSSQLLYSQKKNIQIFENFSADWIEVNADEVFTINIETTNTKSLKLTVTSEGEYTQNIGVKTQQEKNRLLIYTEYPEILTSGYDKLSAHKVFSVRLHIEVPKHKKIIVRSNIASVYAQGTYNFFEAELNAGQCQLKKFKGAALINTLKGDVYIETIQQRVEASSNHGNVSVPENLKIGKEIKVKSIYGDIIIKNPQ